MHLSFVSPETISRRGLAMPGSSQRQHAPPPTPPQDPEEDAEARYCDLLAQAVQLPLELRIRLMEDLRANVQASVFSPPDSPAGPSSCPLP